MSQIIIALTGLVAIYLTQQSNDSIKRWAPVFGLCGQPFWWYETINAQQYGILMLTIAYTYFWVLGIYNQWLKVKK